jgi:hypothetical protein
VIVYRRFDNYKHMITFLDAEGFGSVDIGKIELKGQ